MEKRQAAREGSSRVRPSRLALAAMLLALAGCLAPAAVQPAAVEGAARPLAVVAYHADGAPASLPAAVGTVVLNATGHAGGEPNIGVTKKGSIFVTALYQVLRSRDGGATWDLVVDFGQVGPVNVNPAHDPMLWVDPVTDIVYDDPMFPVLACSSLISSRDDGATWTERDAVCQVPPMDHQRLGSGLPGPKAPPLAGALHPTVLYECYNQVAATECATSDDGGLAWNPPVPVAVLGRDGCAGTDGSPRASPHGAVVVPIFDGCASLLLGVSEDNGLTWSLRPGPPGTGAGADDPSVVFTPDGTMYVTWTGNDFLVRMARSHDLGQTWDGVWKVAPPGVQATAFEAAAAGANGRVAVAFLGTRDAPGSPSDAPASSRWHLFVVTSDDAGAPDPTFVARQATPDDDPVQVGCVWQRGFTVPASECRNLDDFIDAAAGPDGAFRVAFADGCTKECAGSPDAAHSRSQDVTVATLEGWSLQR